MANKHKREVSIYLDKKRKLRFTTNALAELEEAVGYDLTDFGKIGMGVRTIIKMLWAGLLDESPNLTIQEAGELMDYSSISEVTTKINEALELAFKDESTTITKEKKIKSGLSGVGKV